MKKIILVLIVLPAVLMLFSCQSSLNLYPDWNNVTLTAKGEGAPPEDAVNDAQARLMACRSAKMDAYRNLTEKVYGVRVSGSTCVIDYIGRDDRIKSSVQGFIKNAQVVEKITEPDGTCKVKIKLFLGKEFAKTIMK